MNLLQLPFWFGSINLYPCKPKKFHVHLMPQSLLNICSARGKMAKNYSRIPPLILFSPDFLQSKCY